MKVKSLFQRFTSALIGIAIVFGFLAAPAFADVEFSAPNAATTHNDYFVLPDGIEVGVVYSDDNTGRRVLMCNSAYDQPVTGSEWQSTCIKPQKLPASTRLRVQAYSKPTAPNPKICWNCAIPSSTLTRKGFVISWVSEDGLELARTTVTGSDVVITDINVCQDNDLNVNPPSLNF